MESSKSEWNYINNPTQSLKSSEAPLTDDASAHSSRQNDNIQPDNSISVLYLGHAARQTSSSEQLPQAERIASQRTLRPQIEQEVPGCGDASEGVIVTAEERIKDMKRLFND